MQKVIILKGLPASGKTTWAKQLLLEQPGKYKRINKDDLRAMLDAGQWKSDNERFIIKVRNTLLVMALEAGQNVIIDDTNLHEKHEQHIRKLVEGKAEVEIVNFDISLEEAIARDKQREASVGENVIRQMYKQFLKKD